MSKQIHPWFWFILSAFIVLNDQITKIVAVRYLTKHTYTALPFLNFFLSYNPGAAFSFLGQAGGWQRWLLISIGIIVSAWISIWICTTRIIHMSAALTASLILGGALGNLCDRVRLGYVIDFIDFHIGYWHFATFNLADTAVTLGVFLWILRSIFFQPNKLLTK